MKAVSIAFWDENGNKITRKVPYLGDIDEYGTVYNIVGVSNLSSCGKEGTIDFSGFFDFNAIDSHVYWYIDPSRAMGFEAYPAYSGVQFRAFMQSSQPNAPVFTSDSGYGRTCTGMWLGIVSNDGVLQFCLIAEGYPYGGVSVTLIGYGNILPQLYAQATKSGDPFNPYAGGGYTKPGGGGDNYAQNWDDNSDTVVADSLPTIGAMNSGMVGVFSPSAIQLSDLADLLFSYNFFDWLQKNLQNLEQLFVSLGTVPFTVSKGAAKSVTWLGFDVSQFTHPVYLPPVTEQYPEIDMGSISFMGDDPRIHSTDSVFDYSPYSTLGIYLPFIGFQELDIDEIRGTIVNLRYRIDVVSGSCVAIIRVTDASGSRDIYQFSGNCLTQIPLGSVDMSGIVSGSIAIATAAITGGASTAIAGGGTDVASGLASEMAATGDATDGSIVSYSNGSLASATANAMMGMKPNYKHSGAIGNSGSMLAVKQPYLFLKTPREAMPEKYERYCGFPSNITAVLGSLSGYTVVEDIRLNGLVATSEEVEEIYKLLKSGVII